MTPAARYASTVRLVWRARRDSGRPSRPSSTPLRAMRRSTSERVSSRSEAIAQTIATRLRGLDDLQPELLDRLLAHLELLHLAGDGHRELVDELHVARHLEVGD